MEYKISLKAARVNAGLTQVEVAEKIGKIKQTIGKWESGKTQPKANELAALCDLYQVPMSCIILGK